MQRKAFDRETNPACLVGVHYNVSENRYYIVEDWLFPHRRNAPRFSCTKVYKKGIVNAPCDYVRMDAAVRNARLYCDLHFAYKFVGFVPDYLLYGYDGTLEDMLKPFCVGTRRYRGDEYRIYTWRAELVRGAGQETMVHCVTPKNDLGYSDTLLLRDDGGFCQMNRNDVPTWIKNQLKPHMEFVRKTGCFYDWNED